MNTKGGAPPARTKINALVFGYKKLIALLSFFTVSASLLGLLIPKIIARAIDSYAQAHTIKEQLLWEFAIVTFLVFIFTYLQSVVQSYASEVVARDLRQHNWQKRSRCRIKNLRSCHPAGYAQLLEIVHRKVG